MASPLLSSPGPTPAPTPSTLEQAAEEYARRHIRKAKKVPDHIDYDWVPFFTALALRNTDLLPLYNPGDVDLEGKKALGQDRFRHDFDPKKTPSKDPNSGSWDYVWYIPEWSHPDFNPSMFRTYRGKIANVNSAEAIFGLRPAMRTEDTIKRPTDYALRFGIHPDELGGRSRTSPSLSVTRDPFDDLVNQINMLDDADKQQAVDASKSLWHSTNTKPGDSQLIHPSVMENILENKGLLSNKQLVDSLKEALNEKDMNVEQFVAQINMTGPLVRQAHTNFITKAMDDQDYQRVLFMDLTTDEMIKEKIHTLSNEFHCDLEGPLHFILRRDHWDDSSWKGAYPYEPRYLYNLNGKREEWDVSTNDTVWEALQPALQLVTRLLGNRHPHFEALINMETRQVIESWKDPREDLSTPNLAKYVLEKDIDFTRTFPEIVRLNELGYDWKYHTWRVLARCLRFDIGSCYLVPGYYDDQADVDGVREQDIMSYGVTTRNAAGPDSNINITIGAELIWPLLVDEYSQSEKMATSFILASTIIHEIAHATQYAHTFLMESNWIHPIDQPAEVTIQLRRLADQVIDYKFCLGEQCFAETGVAEVGFEVEKALWGFTISSLMESIAVNGSARYLETLPLIAMGRPFPVATGWKETDILLNAEFPVQEYLTPLPLDYIGKFFTQHFWDTEFQAYGFQALKQLPPDAEDRVIKRIMRDDYIDIDSANEKFGERNWLFLACVADTLKSNRYTVLGTYLDTQVLDALRRFSFQKKWTEEVELWADNTLHPLDQEARVLRGMLQESQVTHSKRNASDELKYKYYIPYLTKTQHASVPMTFPEWKDNVEQTWYEDFRVGGRLMTQFAEVHQLMREDLTFLQRMVFDFFNTEFTHRGYLYGGDGSADNTPMGAAYKRIASFRSMAQTLHLGAGAIARIPELVDIWLQWGHWRARFENNFNMYDNMLKLLEGYHTTIDPEDDRWKVQFKTIPTAYWKNRSDRLRVVAYRDFMKLDPRIRNTVDDFATVLTSVNAAVALPEPADVATLNGLLKDIAKNWDDTTKEVIDDKPTIFDFTVPKSVSPPPSGVASGEGPVCVAANPAPPVPAISPQPVAPMGGNSIEVPGLSGTSLGGSPSRRSTRRTPVPGSMPVGGGQEPGVFTQYGSIVNPMQVSIEPGAIPGYPRLWGLGYSGSAFGPGVPFPMPPQPQAQGPGTTRGPFPNPYATPATTTLDIVQEQQRQRLHGLANVSFVMSSGPQIYTTQDKWRDMGSPGSSPGSSP